MPRSIIVGFALFVSLPCLGCAKPGVSEVASPALLMVADVPAADDKSPAPAAKDPPAAPLTSGGEFKFREDDAGKIFARLLPPSGPAPLAPLVSRKNPIDRALPSVIANPETGISSNSFELPRLPLLPRGEPKPSPLTDRTPLEFAQLELMMPEQIAMPVGALTKLETPDVKQPVAVPILANPAPNRASFDDPTVEFTAQSILNDNLPLRSTTAPFVKVNLPDPTENVGAVKIKAVVNEDPLISIGNPPPPKP
jgi:hypothetical protein